MRIINRTKSIIIDKYILKYKYIIEKQYPVLHNHTIEIYGNGYRVYIPTKLDPTVSVSKKNGENLQFDVLIVGFNYNSGANTTLLDRFGEKQIITKLDDTWAKVTVLVKETRTFYSWVLSFGERMEILGPGNVRSRFKDYVRRILCNYSEE